MSWSTVTRLVLLSALVGIISMPTARANEHSPRSIATPDMVLERGTTIETVPVPSLDAGEWHAVLPTAARQGHTAIHDPVRDRMIMFGGSDGNEVWTLPLSGSPEWSPLVASGTKPAVRWDHTAVYDPIRDRMLVFGGALTQWPPSDELWELTLTGTPTWNRLTPAGATPFRRYGHTAIYDPVRERMVVYGGYDGNFSLNDVWELSLSGTPAWTQLAPSGTAPPVRSGHTAIYDPVRGRMLVFGGWDGSVFSTNVWALSLSGSPAWSSVGVSVTSPAGRREHTAIYDPVRDRMVMFAGGTFDTPFNDMWSLTLSGTPQWSVMNPSGAAPPLHTSHSAFYDPVRDRMVVFGGGGLSMYARGWALALSGSPAWSPLLETPISQRVQHSAIHDPVRDRMIVFGGVGSPNGLNDVWELPLAGTPAWNLLSPSGSAPPGRWGHTALYDPVRDRMIVFGGGSSVLYNDLRALRLSGSPAWSALSATGTPPPGLFGHSAVYDPVRDRMIVFGGADDDGNYHNGVWALALAGTPAWIALSPIGGPPLPRYQHAAVYDPELDRMLIFGGIGAATGGDLWSLSLGGTPQWTSLDPIGIHPPGRLSMTAIHDPVRNRIVFFGGVTEGGGHSDAVWSLIASGTAWKGLTPTGDVPSRRSRHTAIYVPARDEMVVFGGGGSNVSHNDVWKLSWDFLVSDVRLPRVPSPIELRAPRPNPAYASAEIRYESARDEHVSLDVLDIQGRIVRRLLRGIQSAGSHTVKFDRRDDRGRALPAGLYLIRLATRDALRTTRIVLLP